MDELLNVDKKVLLRLARRTYLTKKQKEKYVTSVSTLVAKKLIVLNSNGTYDLTLKGERFYNDLCENIKIELFLFLGRSIITPIIIAYITAKLALA